MASKPLICEMGGKGIFLPLGGVAEASWPTGLKTFLYLLGLLYCFCGLAVIGNVLMLAIEKITSRKVHQIKNGKKVTIQVWNETVANLTMMTLGSSAPSMLLPVVQLFGNQFESSSLGPSNIVGSAAFHLLVVTSLCVLASPSTEPSRSLKDLNGFFITSSFSILAFLWLSFILVGTSKDVIEIWEAVLTLVCFPFMVGMAYYVDIRCSRDEYDDPFDRSELTQDTISRMISDIRRSFVNEEMSEQQLMALLHYQLSKMSTRARYRVAATRDLTGGKKVMTDRNSTIEGSQPVVERQKTLLELGTSSTTEKIEVKPQSMINFASTKYSVLESKRRAVVGVVRGGDLSCSAKVLYSTRAGSAKAGDDYTEKTDSIIFMPGETVKTFAIEIVDDDAVENIEEFYIDLFDAQCLDTPSTTDTTDDAVIQIGERRTATVVIIDDDFPGVLCWEEHEVSIKDQDDPQTLTLTVSRRHGGSGTVRCEYYTEDDSALAGSDYVASSGSIEFLPGQMHAEVSIQILGKGRFEGLEKFRVVLHSPTGGAVFDHHTDGGKDSSSCTVWIEPDEGKKDAIDEVLSRLHVNLDMAKEGEREWAGQFIEALYCRGSLEEQRVATRKDWVLHMLFLPWKIAFAFVPPVDYCHGWVSFFCALVAIGLLTAIMSDLACLFGCLLGMPDSFTAILFVALGTSLPDAFAMRAAAKENQHADASIGHLGGSSAVNVFLGLGIPWTIGSTYWSVKGSTTSWNHNVPADIVQLYPDGAFYVDSEGLAFSSLVYSGCAIVCFCILLVRRRVLGGELGGPKPLKYLTSGVLVMIWFLYLSLSAWWFLSE